MKSMKTMLVVLMASAIAVVSGCKTLPATEKMQEVSRAIGVAAGLVANQSKIDDKVRNTVVAIVGEVAKVAPKEGQSFEQAWTPVANDIVAKLVADGKIDEGIGTVSLAAFGVAVKGIDYLFDIRYPKAREYEELVSAAVTGFTEGFLSVFKPATVEGIKGVSLKVDREAYEWLKVHK